MLKLYESFHQILFPRININTYPAFHKIRLRILVKLVSCLSRDRVLISQKLRTHNRLGSYLISHPYLLKSIKKLRTWSTINFDFTLCPPTNIINFACEKPIILETLIKSASFKNQNQNFRILWKFFIKLAFLAINNNSKILKQQKNKKFFTVCWPYIFRGLFSILRKAG